MCTVKTVQTWRTCHFIGFSGCVAHLILRVLTDDSAMWCIHNNCVLLVLKDLKSVKYLGCC